MPYFGESLQWATIQVWQVKISTLLHPKMLMNSRCTNSIELYDCTSSIWVNTLLHNFSFWSLCMLQFICAHIVRICTFPCSIPHHIPVADLGGVWWVRSNPLFCLKFTPKTQEMAFLTFQISKFSGGACPQTSPACRAIGAHKFEPPSQNPGSTPAYLSITRRRNQTKFRRGFSNGGAAVDRVGCWFVYLKNTTLAVEVFCKQRILLERKSKIGVGVGILQLGSAWFHWIMYLTGVLSRHVGWSVGRCIDGRIDRVSTDSLNWVSVE